MKRCLRAIYVLNYFVYERNSVSERLSDLPKIPQKQEPGQEPSFLIPHTFFYIMISQN